LASLNTEAVRTCNYSKRAETNTNTNTPTRPEDVGNVIRLMDEALLCSACDNEARRRLWQYRTVLYCCLIEIK
jgi:hypothetical protein